MPQHTGRCEWPVIAACYFIFVTQLQKKWPTGSKFGQQTICKIIHDHEKWVERVTGPNKSWYERSAFYQLMSHWHCWWRRPGCRCGRASTSQPWALCNNVTIFKNNVVLTKRSPVRYTQCLCVCPLFILMSVCSCSLKLVPSSLKHKRHTDLHLH